MSKILILIFGVVLYSYISAIHKHVNATQYFVSASGSDGNNGTSALTPFATVTKANSVAIAGDEISLHGGDIFPGFSITKTGTSGHIITYDSYGTGQAIISGFTTVGSWTNMGGNIWQSGAISTLTTCNMVSIDGVNTTMGRMPQNTFLIYQSTTGNTSITSSSLNSVTQNWTGAEVVIKVLTNKLRRAPIIGHTGGTLSYSGGGENGQPLWGFFIQNDIRCLTYQNAWYYNPNTKKISIYSISAPGNVKVATTTNLISAGGNKNFITIDNLNLQGSNGIGLTFASDSNVTIQNCNISFTGSDEIHTDVCKNLTIQNNNISDGNNNGIHNVAFESPVGSGSFQGTNVLVQNNNITRIGLIEGMFDMTNVREGFGIRNESTDQITQFNYVHNIGFMPIAFGDGNNIYVQNNIVDSFLLSMNDGGGIYIYNGGTVTHNYTNKHVLNNIVLHAFGVFAGTNSTSQLGDGVYMDNLATHVEIRGNYIEGCSRSAIFLHDANFIGVYDNTLYDNKWQFYFQQDIENSILNDTLSNNIAVCKTSTELVLRYFNTKTNPAFNFGPSDNNVFTRPINETTTFQVSQQGGATNNYTLSQWKVASGKDASSIVSPKTITSTLEITSVYNQTLSNQTTSLPFKYIDTRSTTYNGAITLSTFKSAVLIQNGAITGLVLPVYHTNHNNVK